MVLTPPRITLDIERLLIDGLPPASRTRFQQAFETECAAALADARPRLMSVLPEAARIDVVIPPGASPEAVGRALARGIVRWMSRP